MRLAKGTNRFVRVGRWAAITAVAASLMTGCDVKTLLDPSDPGRYKYGALTLPILNRLDSGVEELNDQFLMAEDVQPSDLIANNADYVLGKNDVINVTVTDLNGPGIETTRTLKISESGNLNIPLVGSIRAEGRTEAELERDIAEGYGKANLLPEAQVTVQVVETRARTFSILGAVVSGGEYAIPRTDFRLLDALVTARDYGAEGIEFVYVIRRPSAESPYSSQVLPAPDDTTTQPAGPDILEPSSSARPAGINRNVWRIDLLSPNMMYAAQPAPGTPTTPVRDPYDLSPNPVGAAPTAAAPTAPPTTGAGTPVDSTVVPPEGEGRYILLDGKPVLVGGTTQPANSQMTPDGQPGVMPLVPATDALAPIDLPATPTTEPFVFEEMKNEPTERVIRVPLPALKSGELKYNIVIKPMDLIIVPPPIQGVYYMGGHVQRTGAYQLSGQRVTLKQAIVAAGMMDALAIPQRTDVIRRIGPDKEVFVRVDLDAIFAGKQPDIYLKPNDTVMVGTNFFAPFAAAIRGAFRFSYGFGFLYDRNYAPSNQNN